MNAKKTKSKPCACQVFGSVQMCAIHAAAPDLLAALKFVQPFLRHVAEENSSVDRTVRAAIAKATGEAA